MKLIGNSLAIRNEQGFDAYVIGNERVEIAVVPELGAKIISLKDLQTGREWMWHPQAGLKLFRNRAGDDFFSSPLVGADECLPTIAACTWKGRELPDHGEVWNLPWTVDTDAWDSGVLRASVRLQVSPFEFTRTIELRDNQVRLGYDLNNLNTRDEPFLWAIHPLMRLRPGDQLELPAHTRALFNGASWLDTVASCHPNGDSAKVFAGPLREGRAAIANKETGDRLEFEWDPAQNNTLGVWSTRGGWHGHHHFALEPTNGAHDALAPLAEGGRCGVVPASSSTSWQVCLQVGS